MRDHVFAASYVKQTSPRYKGKLRKDCATRPARSACEFTDRSHGAVAAGLMLTMRCWRWRWRRRGQRYYSVAGRGRRVIREWHSDHPSVDNEFPFLVLPANFLRRKWQIYIYPLYRIYITDSGISRDRIVKVNPAKIHQRICRCTASTKTDRRAGRPGFAATTGSYAEKHGNPCKLRIRRRTTKFSARISRKVDAMLSGVFDARMNGLEMNWPIV